MKKIVIALGGVLLLVAAYYLVSPLFRNVEVNEALPSGVENLTDAEKADMEQQTLGLAPIPPMNETAPSSGTISEPAAVMGSAGHPASGYTRVVETGDGVFIRYENFMTINGPNLHVYLVKDLSVKEYVDLGAIKGTSGNINYAVPDGVDVSEYKYVIHWCVPFHVLFNYAEIN